jgi:hypothetical protein
MNTKKLSMINKWHSYGITPPYLNKLILIFRIERKKYIIASCQFITDEDGKEKENWITEQRK